MTGLPDLTADPRAICLCKRPDRVPVVFAGADGVCETREGAVTCRAGDALLTGARGERGPVRRDLFLAGYQPILPTVAGQDGTYRKLPSVTLAPQLDRDLAVPVGWRGVTLQGHSGDWLLRYDDGSHGVIQDEILRETYGPVDGECR